MSIEESVIKATQDALTPIIKKPPLTPKLLSKPPFRFLHDIVTGVSTHDHVGSSQDDESMSQYFL